MPFLRIEKKKSGTYLRILQSYRDETGRSTHRILHSLGKVEDYTDEQLRRIGMRFYELGGGEIKNLINGEVEELGRFNYGFQLVYKKVFEHYGLHHVMRRIEGQSRISYSLKNVVMLMLLERLQEPCSKKSNYEHQHEYLDLPSVELHHIYRALDKLSDFNQLIQKQIYQTGRDLFNNKLDVVFYDVTTFYFDSEEEQEQALRQKGFGKDGKLGKTQILFSMLIDKDKNPIGYRIFKGDTFEGHTFEYALEDLKKQYNIEKVIVIADRGMMSAKNIEILKSSNYEYVIGEPFKRLPKAVQEPMLDKSRYTQDWFYLDNEQKQVHVKYATTTYKDRSIICTYSQKRATKDKKDREDRIAKAHSLLAKKSSLKGKAARYFIANELEESYVLDEQRIKRHEQYDGLLAISTNANVSVPQLLEQYKQLYKIEQTFRTFKSHLELRPMFHWTNKRIEGHICMCYMAFAMQNYLLNQVNKRQKTKFSEKSIRKLLSKMQVSLMQQGEKHFYIRSAPQENENYLLQQLGIKPLLPIMDKEMLLF